MTSIRPDGVLSKEPVDACGYLVLLAAVGAALEPRQGGLVLLVAVRRAVVDVHRDRQLAPRRQPVSYAPDEVRVLGGEACVVFLLDFELVPAAEPVVLVALGQ